MRRVLVVDDEENLRVVVRAFLRRDGYEVEVVAALIYGPSLARLGDHAPQAPADPGAGVEAASRMAHPRGSPVAAEGGVSPPAQQFSRLSSA